MPPCGMEPASAASQGGFLHWTTREIPPLLTFIRHSTWELWLLQGEVPQWTVLPAHYLPAHLQGNPLYFISICFLSLLLDISLPLPQVGQPSRGPLPPPSKCPLVWTLVQNRVQASATSVLPGGQWCCPVLQAW